MGSEGLNGGSVYVKSCIFFNFFDQLRLNVNTRGVLERCHLSEARNNSLHALNPCALRVEGCNFSKAGKHGICCEWLARSSQTSKCRRLTIEACDFTLSGSASIIIQPSHKGNMKYFAHNLIVEILNNKVNRSKGEGLTVINLILTMLRIKGNEFNLNQLHNLYIKQVHQKSNKCASASMTYLGVFENRFWQSERGAGAYVVDSGFLFEGCHFRSNKLGGLVITGTSTLSSSITQQTKGGLT